MAENLADTIDIAQYQFDAGPAEMPQGFLVDEAMLLHDKYGRNVFYLNIAADSLTPPRTNHLSPTRFSIVEGMGRFVVGGAETEFDIRGGNQSGPVITVPRKQAYSFEGNFSALVERPVEPFAAFITIGDERLSKEAEKILRRIEWETIYENAIGAMGRKIEPMSSFVMCLAAQEARTTSSLDTQS